MNHPISEDRLQRYYKEKNHPISEDTLRDYYKILINSVNECESRKYNINSFFTTINSILITGFGFMISNGDKIGSQVHYGVCSLMIMGFLSIFEWKKLIDYINHTLVAKHLLIKDLEEKLALDLFTRESALNKKFFQASYKNFFLENKIPLSFIFIYLFFFKLAFFS